MLTRTLREPSLGTTLSALKKATRKRRQPKPQVRGIRSKLKRKSGLRRVYHMPRSKKARVEEITFKEALTAVKVAIISEGFPEAQMEQERLKAFQKAVITAYERATGTLREMHLVRHLVVACADEISTQWLRDIIPSLKRWKDGILRTLVGSEIPKPYACIVYVPLCQWITASQETRIIVSTLGEAVIETRAGRGCAQGGLYHPYSEQYW